VADAVEDSEEVASISVFDRRELEQAITEFSAFEDFRFNDDLAVGRGKDKALADGYFTAGPDEGAPEVVANGLGKHDFDAAGWFLVVA
jgi:hypothetical protein